jgi:hypothetical protein
LAVIVAGSAIYLRIGEIRLQNWERGSLILNAKHEKSDDIFTVYAQGFGAPFHQVAKYVGEEGINLSNLLDIRKFCDETYGKTGLHAKICRFLGDFSNRTKIYYAPLLLYNVHVPSKDLGDIHCQPEYDHPLDTFGDVILFVYNWPITGLLYAKRFASDFYFGVENGLPCQQNLRKTNIGGFNDLVDYDLRFQSAIKANENNNKSGVLFGTSRGGSLTFKYLSTMQQREYLDRIKLVLLEGPFDDLRATLHETYPFGLGRCVEWLLNRFCDYTPYQVPPISVAKNFPLNIPVAFIMTRNDATVPMARTENLIDAVKRERTRAGMVDLKVHELVLDENAHHEMSVGPNLRDAFSYKKFVDELYDLYL